MKKWIFVITAAVALTAVLSSCMISTLPTMPSVHTDGTAAFYESKNLFKLSDFIVKATCIAKNGDGDTAKNDLIVKHHLFGRLNVGQVFSIYGKGFEPDCDYLLYLAAGEDGAYQTVVSPFRMVGDDVIWSDGTVIPLSDIKTDIGMRMAIIEAPGEVYFHEDYKGLVNGSDLVVSANVLRVSMPSETTLRYTAKGITAECTVQARRITLLVEECFKGDAEKWSIITVIYVPDSYVPMLSSATHDVFDGRYAPDDIEAILKVGAKGMFFLKKSPDERHNVYFPVNPLQGIMRNGAERKKTNTVVELPE